MKCFIVTGASKGLGEAIIRKLLKPGHTVIGISRHKNAKLIADAAEAGVKLDYIEFDLANTEHLEAVNARIFGKIQKSELTGLYLINNAGTIEPIGPIHKSTGESIDRNVKINLTAPMILTANFMKWSQSLAIDKRILNISTGAARKPYTGWSAYCAAKAGLDHFTRCVAEEQKELEHGVRISSVRPGVIDTDMQATIRASKEEDFKDVQRFIAYKESGELLSPESVADRMLELLLSDTFGEEPVM